MRRPALLAVAPLLLALPAFAASFNCKLATTAREKAICSNPELSKADDELAAAYKELRAKLSAAGAAEVQADQREWLGYLDRACGKGLRADREDLVGCLRGEYTTRKDQMHGEALPSGQILFSRALNVAKLVAPEADNQFDPGVGIGNYTWPEIDKAAGQQIAFNNAAKAMVLKMSTFDPKHKPATLEAATGERSSMEVSWSLSAANGALLSVDYELFFMGYGGAHPNTFDSTLQWNISAGRELQVTDIFDDASGWRTKLVPLVRAKLSADKDLAQMLWDGPELLKGVREGLTAPGQWTLSRGGFAVTFGQYQVAAYAGGMPAAEFSWSELKPYLRPGFDPATLPATAAAKGNDR